MKAREFKRIWGEAWDSCFLLEIEKRKLTEIRDYIAKHKRHVDWALDVRDMNICLKLLDIILEKDQYYTSWLHNCYGSRPHKQLPFPVYVNLRNYKRFIPCLDINKYNKSLMAHLQSNIRKEKAMYLYNKIRAYKMLGWWD